MGSIMTIVLAVLMLAVVFVLARGIGGFAGGKDSKERGRHANRLMQWRVGLQFLAVIVALAMLALVGGK